jgi:transcriptional regulator with XRE-family HTH domain
MLHKDVFCIRVKKLRKARKEQQIELADAIGVKQSTISDIENGRRTTSFDKLAAICKHYNVSADYLLGLIDEPRPLKKEGPL